MSSADLILFDNENSPCARRVRISLREKGLAYQMRNIDLSHLEQRSPAFLAINPNGLVPTLAHGGLVVWESNVITEYLDDAFPEMPLYPSDPWERVAVKRWQAAELAMAKDFRPVMYHRLMGPLIRSSHTLDEVLAIARTHTHDPVDLEWERKVWALEVLTSEDEKAFEARLYGFVDKLEETLAHGREWLVGTSLSQAEIAVYPRLAMYPLLGLTIDPARWPGVVAWMQRIADRPSFAQSRSRSEASLASLAGSRVYRFLRRSLAIPDARRGLARRLALKVIGRVVRRQMAQVGITDQSPMPDVRRRALPPPLVRRKLRPISKPVIRLGGRADTHPGRLLIEMLLREKELEWTDGHDDGPLISVDGQPIDHVIVAIELLDAVTGGTPLIPSDAAQAAEARMWLAFDASMFKEFQPLFETEVLLRNAVRFDTDPESARIRLRQRLDQVADRLAGRQWLASDGFTAADAALATSLSFFPRLGIDWTLSHRAIADWHRRVIDRPSALALRAIDSSLREFLTEPETPSIDFYLT